MHVPETALHITCLATRENEPNTDVSVRDDSGTCNEIDSLAINSVPEVLGKTNVLSEACSHVDVLGSHYIPTSIHSKENDIQDLLAYFKRPRILYQGDLPLASVEQVYVDDINSNTLFQNAFPEGRNRLLGAYGVKFDLVFTLQVAATPFHQGLLALSFQYGSQALDPGTYSRSTRVGTVLHLPHTRLDLSNQTMAVLTVPWMCVAEFLTIRDPVSFFPYGHVAVNTVLPIASVTGIVAPTFKLMIQLANMELISVMPSKTEDIVMQAGRTLGVEAEYKLSDKVSVASKAFAFVARNIPMLSSVAAPTSWFLAASSGALRAFGYSKPQIQEPVQRVLRGQTAGEQNVDLPSATQLIGPMASNHLRVDGSFGGTAVDEMSLAYVCSQYSPISITTYDVLSPHGTPIYGSNVGPSTMWFRYQLTTPAGNLKMPLVSSGTTNSFMPSNVFYWASMFRLWRSGFTFRFTFSKTKMHGGRVLCTYTPWTEYFPVGQGSTTFVAPADEDSYVQPTGYSAMFDLRDDNVFEFHVPYTAPHPYLNFASTMGSLSLVTMDNLQAPTVVSNVIHVLVEVKADTDIDLAIPRGIRYPAHPKGTPINQSGRVLSVIKPDACELTIGEKITSVKQLIMIPKWTESNFLSASTQYTMSIMPWFYHRNPPSTAPFPDSQTFSEGFSYGGNAAACYVFARGGTDVHAYPVNGEGVYLEASYVAPDRGIYGTPQSVQSGSSSCMPRIAHGMGTPLHVRYPAYHIVPRIRTWGFNAIAWTCSFTNSARNFSWTDVNWPSFVAIPQLRAANGGTAATNVKVCRSAADDAALAMYIGPPPMALPSPTATGTFDPDYVNGTA